MVLKDEGERNYASLGQLDVQLQTIVVQRRLCTKALS